MLPELLVRFLDGLRYKDILKLLNFLGLKKIAAWIDGKESSKK